MIDIVGKRRWYFLASGILILIGIISMIVSQAQLGSPLRLGTDFTGGTTMMLHFNPSVAQSDLRDEMARQGHDGALIQYAGEGDFIVHTTQITSDEARDLAALLGEELDSEVSVIDYRSTSPAVAARTARDAFIAVIIAAVAMMLYIVWAFRRMPSPLRWGACAVIALLHDVFIIIGIFSLLGWFAGVTVDAMFITGILAVVGYSINNTVVIFDRIRENVSKQLRVDFETTVNDSLVETLSRCLNTALTTLFVLLALFLFGGTTIQYFVLVLLLGVIIGTYSSLGISSQLLVVWEKRDWRSLLPFARRPA
ncbi:MAG: protein translocase subunit SecF [Dehalococcoidia bacterium]